MAVNPSRSDVLAARLTGAAAHITNKSVQWAMSIVKITPSEAWGLMRMSHGYAVVHVCGEESTCDWFQYKTNAEQRWQEIQPVIHNALIATKEPA